MTHQVYLTTAGRGLYKIFLKFISWGRTSSVPYYLTHRGQPIFWQCTPFTQLNQARPADFSALSPLSSTRLTNRSSRASLRSRAPCTHRSTRCTSHISAQRIAMLSRIHTPVVHTANGALVDSPPLSALAPDPAPAPPKLEPDCADASPRRAVMRAVSVRGCARR